MNTIRFFAVFFAGMALGCAVQLAWLPANQERGLVLCHADGTAFIGHIDVRGISWVDLDNAVAMMCRFKADRGV